jgi:hypothetical protein
MLRRTKIRIWLVVWLALIGGLTWWDSSAQSQHQPQQAKNESGAQKTSDYGSKNSASSFDGFSAWLGGRTESQITATATVFIAIFTVVLGIGTVFLVSDGRKHSRRQLRAYVLVIQAKIIDPDGPNPTAELMIRNTGQTPAYDVTVSTAANTANVPPGRTEFDPTPVTPDSSRFVFGPNGTGKKDIPLSTFLNANSMPGLRSGVGVLHVWGTILYVDAFKNDRWTHFRFMIGGANGWPSSDLMVICHEGNDADH